MILEKTIKIIEQFYQNQEISEPNLNEVVIGLGYTGVEIYTPQFGEILGVAHTLSEVIKSKECSKIEFPGKLTDKDFYELLKWGQEPPSLKKIIGIATINAASQHIIKIKNPYNTLKKDLVEYLGINSDTKIFFIGLIKPMIRQIAQKTKNITIIEKELSFTTFFEQFETKKTIDELNENEKRCDILFCTGSTLINNTLVTILNLFRTRTKFIAMIGPTVSMIPDVLFESGVDLVGGMTIQNSQETLKILQEGGGTRFFKNYGKKYNIIK
jgi:uncharacterized protein (DUF4213/DUF364 family)